MWKGSTRKRPLQETDYERLKRALCGGSGAACLNEADLEALRGGEAAFFWESPLAASAEEAAAMARQAAREMAPAPGRVVLAVVLYAAADARAGLSAVDAVAAVIQRELPVEGVILFGAGTGDGQGIRFLLAASEGRAAGRGEAQ